MYIFETDGDYVNFNGGGNLWRIHKSSNVVRWHWDETGDLFFDVYDQQYVVKRENISTITIGGITLSVASDFETNIKKIFPGSYKVYTALLTQSGADAPIATVLENTLGGTVVWTRNGFGDYVGTLAGVFTIGKTISLPFGNFTTSNTAFMRIGGANAGGLFDGYYTIYPIDINSISINVVFNDFSNIDLSSLIGAGSIYIEIRVYP